MAVAAGNVDYSYGWNIQSLFILITSMVITKTIDLKTCDCFVLIVMNLRQRGVTRNEYRGRGDRLASEASKAEFDSPVLDHTEEGPAAQSVFETDLL